MHYQYFSEQWNSGVEDFTIESSGSTGEPKTFQLKRNWIIWSAMQTADILGLENEHILCCIPTNKVGGFMMMARAKVLNFPISVQVPKSNPMEELEPEHDYTFVSLVPYQLYQILNDQGSLLKFNRFKHVLIGGADLGIDTIEKLHELSPAIYLTYGMTETYSHIALRKLSGKGIQQRFVLLPGFSIHTLENDCLVIQTPYLDEPIITNDIAEIFPDNSFSIKGRVDFIINSGGLKISPEWCEKLIDMAGLLPLNKFLILPIPHHSLGHVPVIVIEPDIEIPEDLLSKVKAVLPLHFHARDYWILDEIPKTETGKPLRKKAIELLYLQHINE
jgi:o-succinylbenzoate---CoA ligase